MIVVQQSKSLGKEGVRVWAVNPGWRATNLSGNAEAAAKRGALDPEGGALVIVDVVEGRKDGDVGKHVDENGGLDW